MFGISGEHLLVLLVILLIFGPKRLPDLGHSIGRTLKNFKDGLNSHQEAQDRAAERERLERRNAASAAVAAASPAPAANPSTATPAPSAAAPTAAPTVATAAAQGTAEALGASATSEESREKISRKDLV